MTFFATHHFMPIGQGLFGTGAIGHLDKRPLVRWVYDCGTLSERALMTNSLNALEQQVKIFDPQLARPRLDLVVISHFDSDHLNGLAELLSRFRVETLMLPFTHLEQRVRAMFAMRAYTSKADQRFMVDPVGTIATLPDTDIGRIILVPPSGTQPVPPPDQPNDPPPVQPRGQHDEHAPPIFSKGEPSTAEEREEFDAARQALKDGPCALASVSLMQRNSALLYAHLWEFVPFNDPAMLAKVDDVFLNAVKARRTQLMASSTLLARKNAIAGLKKLYDARFGDRGKGRNLISLFLYAGPMKTHRSLSHVHTGSLKECAFCCNCNIWPCDYFCCWHLRNPLRVRSSGGFLYTGDGFVEKPSRWQTLESFFGGQRFSRLLGLQVMHHGSRRNWYKGLAATIAPAVSVFSSDPSRGGSKPKHKSHPHAEVWKDFEPYGRMQADKTNGVQIVTTCSPYPRRTTPNFKPSMPNTRFMV